MKMTMASAEAVARRGAGAAAIIAAMVAVLAPGACRAAMPATWHAGRGCCVHAQRDPRRRVCVPPGESIVLMGDSITRYMYVDLAYSLRYGANRSWAFRNASNPLSEKSWARGWSQFFRTTHTELNSGPSGARADEWCDCYRGGRHFIPTEYVEARYLHARACGVNVTYIAVFGRLRVLGHLWGPWGLKPPHAAPRGPMEHAVFLRWRKRMWRYEWSEAVRRVVAPLRPSVLVLNQGLWDSAHLVNYTALRAAAAAAATRVVWRSTTKRASRPRAQRDEEARAAFADDTIFEAGELTERLGLRASQYVDDVHFQPETGAYNAVNIGLLEALYGGRAARAGAGAPAR